MLSYRKRQGPAAPDLATGRNATAAGSSSAARSDEPENEITNEEAKIRCPCGNANEAGTMIQVVAMKALSPKLVLHYQWLFDIVLPAL